MPPSSIQHFDAIILGAGAAGLMCAIEAGRGGKRVALVDHAERIGKKILISGGGRCNFTNLHCTPANFLSANPHFAKSAHARYTPQDFIDLVEVHGIAYHEKTLGQLFCDGSAKEIVAMLEKECALVDVKIFVNTAPVSIRHSGTYVIETTRGELHASSLVVATGGPSIPKMGATGFGYEVAEQFGLKVITPRPSLVPLTFDAADQGHYCDLAGLSAEAIVSVGPRSAGSVEFREKLLITHRGLSGPAILQASSYWSAGESIFIDLAPDRDWTASLREPKARRDTASLSAALCEVLPQRLATRWIDLFPPSAWTNAALHEANVELHHWAVTPNGTEGYEKAEVTAGGVDTDELFAKTMECRKVPGLYFIGEVVDVTGHLGGFNFQWAWASGAAAGRAIAAL
jgi:predicted Rossmann fold flavoprotein